MIAMSKSATLLAATALLVLAACDKAGVSASASAGPDLIVHGGPILTMAGDAPAYAEAIAVKDGRIVQVGTEAAVMPTKDGHTIVKDLAGKLLMPGFIDPHSHFIDSLTMADRVNVSAPPVGPVVTS